MAVAIAGASSPYTAVSTQIASASATCETQAPLFHESFGCRDLSRVVARHEPDQDLRINGAHGALSHIAESRLSSPRWCGALGLVSGIMRNGYLRTYSTLCEKRQLFTLLCVVSS